MQRVALPLRSEHGLPILLRRVPEEIDWVRVLCSRFVQSVLLHRCHERVDLLTSRCELMALHCRMTLHVPD